MVAPCGGARKQQVPRRLECIQNQPGRAARGLRCGALAKPVTRVQSCSGVNAGWHRQLGIDVSKGGSYVV